MRTTLDLNDAIIRLAKRRAAENGRSLTAFIEDALRIAMVRAPSRGKVRLRVNRRGLGLKQGLSWDDTSGLLELIEDRDVPR